MNLLANYFGNISYTKEDIVYFPNGLFGFEEETDFLPLPFDPASDFMLSLQSVKTPSLSFIIMNPFYLLPSYEPYLSKEDQKLLQISKDFEKDISYYVISVIHDEIKDCTINLKCPIAVNNQNRYACQIMLDSKDYTFRHALSTFQKKEESHVNSTAEKK